MGTSALHAVDWNGTTSSDWNTPANWTPSGVPNGANAVINTVTPNYPVIVSNLLFNPNDVIIGEGAGLTGQVDQSAGQVITNAWMYCGTKGGTGTSNLTGSGKLTVNGRLYVGGSFTPGGGTGTMTINTTDILTTTSDIAVGASGGTGTLQLNAGT